MIEFVDIDDNVIGVVVVRDGALLSDPATEDIATAWLRQIDGAAGFEDAYDGWTNGYARGRRVSDDSRATTLTASSSVFHLPGKHDQDKHGHDQGSPGGSSESRTPLKITRELIQKQYPPLTVVAVTKNGEDRLMYNGRAYVIQRKKENTDNIWVTHKALLDKDEVYDEVNAYSSEWFEPAESDLISVASKSSAPSTETKPSTPSAAPTSSPSTSNAPRSQSKTFTPQQKQQVTSIFAKNGVKWHNDTKKIYDSALEVSKTYPDLTMSDALDVMDQSLQKKTGNPFRSKVEKFLKTDAGKQYALLKGSSSSAGATEQTTLPTSVTPSSSDSKTNTSSISPSTRSVDAKHITSREADELKKEMDDAYPPPWTAAQRAALRKYTGSSYRQISKCLRNKSGCTPDITKTIEQIRTSMKPSTRDIKIYRNAGFETFGVSNGAELDSLQSKIIKDDGIVSTSIKELSRPGLVHLEIDAPKGSKLAWIKHVSDHPEEDEILIAPDTHFEIIEVKPHPQYSLRRIVRLRIIPGSDAP